MKIAIGADHAGFELKEMLKEYLKSTKKKLPGDRCGALSFEPRRLSRVPAAEVGEWAAARRIKGYSVCDSGIGVDIVANKVRVRSALVSDEELAKITLDRRALAERCSWMRKRRSALWTTSSRPTSATPSGTSAESTR